MTVLRNWELELGRRCEFIGRVLKTANAKGVVFGNSGGKDSALVGILSRRVTGRTLGLIMPCESRRNYRADRDHARLLAERFGIEVMEVDLSGVKAELVHQFAGKVEPTQAASANINPRLRMATLYAVAQSRDSLVAGTGNRSEIAMGYYTKWGDGASDFNPIADLTVTEIYDFLRYLGAPEEIIDKEPSGGLWDGQTDEGEMGITYRVIDDYLLYGRGNEEDIAKIRAAEAKNAHKRRMPVFYGE